jgi:hypothetical protein
MRWEGGRRSGRVLDRRGAHRVDALLARSPTFMRNAGPALTGGRFDMRYNQSGVSDTVREMSRNRRGLRPGRTATMGRR